MAQVSKSRSYDVPAEAMWTRIGDFEAEKTSLSQLASQIEQQQQTTEAQLRERAGRLGIGVERQFRRRGDGWCRE